jgi:hypothetical protein
MGRVERWTWLFFVITVLSLAACASPWGLREASPSAVAPTVRTASPTPRPEAVGTATAAEIVGVWTAVDGSLHLEFFSDGRFARYYGGREDDPEEFWAQEGVYWFGGRETLTIDLRKVGTTEFEFRLEEPWLTLRDESGRVIRYRRNPGWL